MFPIQEIQTFLSCFHGFVLFSNSFYWRTEESYYKDDFFRLSKELILRFISAIDFYILLYFLRYITVAYFLNDVDDGGEVVLPLANSKFEVCTPLSMSNSRVRNPI